MKLDVNYLNQSNVYDDIANHFICSIFSVQDATFIENAYTQINNLTFELEQERVKNKELENQVAQFNEHLEEAVAQLDETGRQLDNANFEVKKQ